MLDTLAGIESIIARGQLPPRIRYVIAEISRNKPLSEIHPASDKELRAVLQLVDGPGLLAAIVGRLLENVPVEEIQHELDAQAEAERPDDHVLWQRAIESEPDRLVLLLVGDSYVAFGHQAETIAAATGEHLYEAAGQPAKLALPLGKQLSWQTKIHEANLDVALLEHDDDGHGYEKTFILDAQPAAPEGGSVTEEIPAA